MIDNICIYKSLNINIEIVMKNQEMLKFIPDHLKTKQIRNYPVKRLPSITRYIPDQFKTKKMCNRAIQKMVKH